METATDHTAPPERGHDWREAGAAWGHRADDWACLYEHYSLDILFALAPRLGLGPGVRVLDIACGSGLGARLARSTGADVAGIDAAEDLVAIAQGRVPDGDLRVGTMFELPWADESFDAAMSVNGIWGGCEAALAEARRVLRPGAPFGMSYWGMGPPLDLRRCFKVFAFQGPDPHRDGMKRLNDISRPGVAEEMLEAAGFDVVESGARTSVIEWPDPDIAWRAISSMGPAVPALRTNDPQAIRTAVLEAIEPCRVERGVYRFVNDHRFVVARRP